MGVIDSLSDTPIRNAHPSLPFQKINLLSNSGMNSKEPEVGILSDIAHNLGRVSSVLRMKAQGSIHRVSPWRKRKKPKGICKELCRVVLSGRISLQVRAK